MGSTAFRPESIDEDPATFHARDFDGLGRALWIPTLTSAQCLVLGSSQASGDVDTEAVSRKNISVVRRRTGGGAVLVSAADLVWFDVLINAEDPLWTSDVGRSFDWLGDAAKEALASLGVDAEVHRGRLRRTAWSKRVCFAGLGPGELTVDDKKVVGMSQRRTRSSARFQVAILRRWSGHQHQSLFVVPPDEREAATEELGAVAIGLPHSPTTIIDAIVGALT